MADQTAVEAVLADDFMGEITERPMAELRQLREQFDAVESKLSFSRRILHGHLDLLRSEIARRDLGAESGPFTDILGTLGQEQKVSGRSPSHQRMVDGLDLADLEGGTATISADLPDCSNDELRARAEEMVAREHALSQQRRSVLERLDRLQVEVVRRYREGEASIDEILPGSA